MYSKNTKNARREIKKGNKTAERPPAEGSKNKKNKKRKRKNGGKSKPGEREKHSKAVHLASHPPPSPGRLYSPSHVSSLFIIFLPLPPLPFPSPSFSRD